MSDRRSIDVPGYSHGPMPIPAASRIGNIVMTGGVSGTDPETGALAPGLADQARLMFANLTRILEAADAGLKDVIKLTVFIADPEARNALNEEWLKAFPDQASRPARHVLNHQLHPGMLLQCEAMAVLTEYAEKKR